MREIVILQCTECKRRNYSTTRNKKQQTDKIQLKINDETLPINDYIKLLIKKLNLALISTLKGVDEDNMEKIEISIELGD